MRRLVFFLMLALVAAGFAGRLVSSPGIQVGTEKLTTNEVVGQLNNLPARSLYACFLNSHGTAPLTRNTLSYGAASTASFADALVLELAVESYLKNHYHAVATPTDLLNAHLAYEDDLHNARTLSQQQCISSVHTSLAELPSSFVNARVLGIASTMALENQHTGALSLSASSRLNYFHQHLKDFASYCFAGALVPAVKEHAFIADEAAGWTITRLASTFSAQKTTNGSLGCYSPSYPGFAQNILGIANTTPLHKFSSAHPATYGGQSYGIFYAITSEKLNSYASVSSQVFDAMRTYNERFLAADAKNFLKQYVAVNPEFGTWSSTNLVVKPPASPSKGYVTNDGTGLGF